MSALNPRRALLILAATAVLTSCASGHQATSHAPTSLVQPATNVSTPEVSSSVTPVRRSPPSPGSTGPTAPSASGGCVRGKANRVYVGGEPQPQTFCATVGAVIRVELRLSTPGRWSNPTSSNVNVVSVMTASFTHDGTLVATITPHNPGAASITAHTTAVHGLHGAPEQQWKLVVRVP